MKEENQNLNKIVTIVIAVIAVIIAVVGVVMHMKNDGTTVNPETGQKVENKSTKVEFGGYEYQIPAGVTASVQGTKLFIYGPSNKWVACLLTQAGASYDQLLSVKDQIKTSLANQPQAKTEGYNLSNAVTEEKEYGGKKFLITRDIATKTYNIDITYSAFEENSVYVISVTKSNGDKMTDQERTAAYSIVASAKKTA